MRVFTCSILALACLVPCAAQAQAPDWSHARTIEVELSNFSFTPSTLDLEHGVPYLLHLTNSASGGHDFSAKELFAASTVAPQDRDRIKDGRIELDGHESADVRLIPTKPGAYKIRCTHFMHSAFGMTGTVTVK